jgi:hypothetical protein
MDQNYLCFLGKSIVEWVVFVLPMNDSYPFWLQSEGYFYWFRSHKALVKAKVCYETIIHHCFLCYCKNYRRVCQKWLNCLPDSFNWWILMSDFFQHHIEATFQKLDDAFTNSNSSITWANLIHQINLNQILCRDHIIQAAISSSFLTTNRYSLNSHYLYTLKVKAIQTQFSPL